MINLCGCHPNGGRRSFLTSLAAGAMTAGCVLPAPVSTPPLVTAATAATAAASAQPSNRIDTHHHIFSPAYVAELAKVNQAPPIVRNWSVNKTLDDMQAAGVATAIVSVTTPQVSFADAASAPRIARESNEWSARLNRDYPGKFGQFAMLPMHNMDLALREMEYALDVLKADGIGLLTSYGDKWLGDVSFEPLMVELNRRKAILYTHPTVANCCRNLQKDVPVTVVEFGTDTTRTIVDLVFSGRAAQCPNVRFIFSHAGGTLPFLTERLVKMPVLDPSLQPRVPNGVMHELKRFYYDTAWSAHAGALASLLKLVGVSQVLLGSDYPYRTGIDHVRGLADYGLSQADQGAINRENALKLLPRLA